MSTSARRLKIPHPSLINSQKTYFDADYATGTGLTVQNNISFAANQIAVAGEPGEEKTESKPVASITSSTTITLTGAYNFSHNKGGIIYRSEYDQVEVSTYVSSWSVLSTIDIQWDQLNTIYVHDGGTNANSYRFRFKNSASSNYSEYSPTIGGSGFAKNKVGYMVSRVRKILGDPEKKIVTDEEIMQYLTDAKDIIKSRRNDWWFWKKEDEGTITTIASTLKYNLDDIGTDIEYVADIRFNYNDGTINTLYPIPDLTDVEFDDLVRDQSRTDDDNVINYNIVAPDDSSTSGYIRCFPTPKTTGYGSFYVRYYVNEADYTSVSDTTSIPLSNLLIYYALSVGFQVKGNEEKARVYENLFFGPPPTLKKRSGNMVGIALLERMQDGKGRSTKKMRQMKTFRGRAFSSRVYSDSLSTNQDQRREDYW